MSFEPWQYLLGFLAACIIGFSKAGVPGTGILVVPIMAFAFGGWLSIGATLPMLIVADCVAVATYRAHAQWDRIRVLVLWVALGLALGTVFLIVLGGKPHAVRWLDPMIGAIVLLMLIVSLQRQRLGDQFAPTSPAGLVATGALAGFTTMTSNAAGPVMAIYMAATGMPKEQLMGTSAWYFLILNVVKLPLLAVINAVHPTRPIVTEETLLFNALMMPALLAGAMVGRATFPHIPQKAFNALVLALAGLGGVLLLFR